MEWLKPPNKNWNLNFHQLDSSTQTAGSGQSNPRRSTAAGTVPATFLDSTQSQASQESPKAEENGDNWNARGRSPRRHQNGAGNSLAQPAPLDPKDMFLVDYPGWTVEDLKGQGDCGYRTAARAVAYQQNKDLNEEKLAREASKLRVLSIGHLIKNKEIH